VSHAARIAIALTVFAGGTATAAGYGPVASSHLFAPAPSMPCPAPYHLETSWYRGSQLAAAEAGGQSPGGDSVIHWLGWTELVGCGQSLVASTGANP
jgi:hypothetical protein